jgi:hypothetical protein
MTQLTPRPTYTAPARPKRVSLKPFIVHYTTRAGFRASWTLTAPTQGAARFAFQELLPTGRINLISLQV